MPFTSQAFTYPPMGEAWEINPKSPQAAGIVADWPMFASRGMNKLRDLGGRGLDGTFNGGLTWAADAQMGAALTFDGSTGYVAISPPSLTGEMSISCRFNSTTVATSKCMIGDADVTGGTYQYLLLLNHVATYLTLRWSSGGTYTLTGNKVLAANTWYHVLATRVGTTGAWTGTIYVNGVQDNQSATTINPPAQQGVSIGRRGLYSGYYWSGMLADVRLYNFGVPAPIAWQMYSQPWDLYRPVARWWVGFTAGAPSFSPSTLASLGGARSALIEAVKR